MGAYLLKGEVFMGMAFVTLRLYIRKGLYVGHIQWDRMRKSPTEWSNIYGSGVLEMGVIGRSLSCSPGPKGRWAHRHHPHQQDLCQEVLCHQL